MADEGIERRLAAILAADVVGYSRLMEADEEGTLTRLRALRHELFEPKTRQHGGRIFKITGDGALVEFKSASEAVRSAVEIQRALGERNKGVAEDKCVALRIGISLGDVMVQGSDLYGNGVNIAARMEALAEPGGICISGNVQEQVRSAPGLAFDDLGEQSVKNIERPIRAYRVGVGESAERPSEGARAASPTVPVDKPSIAVLPFDDLSGEAERDIIGDGLTEDIITGLSRIRSFFVIARNSTFQYKGASRDIRKVAADLGVRYVLEGSVRRAGNRVRITAQLIDGETGAHLWAERFDRDLDDIFAIQDEITGAIVGRLEPELGRAEYERVKGKTPDNLTAWELFHRGMMLVSQRTREATERARALFEQSLNLDRAFAPAYAGLSWCYTESIFFRYADLDPQDCLEFARRAVALDDKDPFAHFALGWAHQNFRQVDLAIDEMKTALRINPSYAHAHALLGRLLIHSGHAEQGLDEVELAMQLSPSDPNIGQWTLILSIADLHRGHYDDAVALARKCIQTHDTWVAWMIMTAALGHLGAGERAGEACAALLARQPGISIGWVRENYLVFHEPSRQHLFEGLRKAGLPE